MNIIELMNFKPFRDFILSGDEFFEFVHHERNRAPGAESRKTELYTLKNQTALLCRGKNPPARFSSGDDWKDSVIRNWASAFRHDLPDITNWKDRLLVSNVSLSTINKYFSIMHRISKWTSTLNASRLAARGVTGMAIPADQRHVDSKG